MSAPFFLRLQEVGTSEGKYVAWRKELCEPEPEYDQRFRTGAEEALADL